MLITKQILLERWASDEYIKKFIAEFPEGMSVSRPNLEKCLQLHLGIEWLEYIIPADKFNIFLERVPATWNIMRDHGLSKLTEFQTPIIDALVAALGGDE